MKYLLFPLVDIKTLDPPQLSAKKLISSPILILADNDYPSNRDFTIVCDINDDDLTDW